MYQRLQYLCKEKRFVETQEMIGLTASDRNKVCITVKQQQLKNDKQIVHPNLL